MSWKIQHGVTVSWKYSTLLPSAAFPAADIPCLVRSKSDPQQIPSMISRNTGGISIETGRQDSPDGSPSGNLARALPLEPVKSIFRVRKQDNRVIPESAEAEKDASFAIGIQGQTYLIGHESKTAGRNGYDTARRKTKEDGIPEKTEGMENPGYGRRVSETKERSETTGHDLSGVRGAGPVSQDHADEGRQSRTG